MEQSKALLLEEDILIKDISAKVGFFSINTYIRLFKKFEGIPPSLYREKKMSASGREGEQP
ncbi:Bacterial regulatory helix-turn-helix protein, AraC family [compost metagenome]